MIRAQRVARVAMVGVIAFLGLGITSGAARADFGFQPGGAFSEITTTQAGAHPDLSLDFQLNTKSDLSNDGSLRTFVTDLPRGFIGNPFATPRCTAGRVNDLNNPCPRSTIVGYVSATIQVPGSPEPGDAVAAVYNIEPNVDSPAALATAPFVPLRFDAEVRSNGDYGIRVTARNVREGVGLQRVRLTLWGVPADHNGEGSIGTQQGSLGGRGPGERLPFLSNPTSCGFPSSVGFFASPWEPDQPSASVQTAFPAISGCERLSFDPSVRVAPATSAPGVPSGYTVDIDTPQTSDPDGLATPTLKNAVVTLPPGLTIAPGAANGLAGCTSSQFGLHVDGPPGCSNASKVGEATITSPLLASPITGGVYVGQPEPGNRYRLFLSASGFGVDVKLEGSVSPDPATGQLQATFANNPELPFSNLHVNLYGGSRAILANPTSCGSQSATAALTSHGGQVATPTSVFSISCPGITGFAPTFDAGSTLSTAGHFAGFGVRLARTDSSQFFSGVSVGLPTGLLARLRGVPLCPDAAAQAGTCSSASRVGTATVGAGPGPNPYYLRGTSSLAGPYRGAPYSLSTAVRAIAGPFDLGTVVVRQALFVDRTTAAVRVVSDPLPTILEGVPLRLRSISVDLDRPGFTFNPTSCASKRIDGALTSTQGTVASRSVGFQASNCRALKLSPKLALRLSGKASALRDGGHPSLKAILTQPRGQSNLRSLSVKLPASLALDPDNANGLCEYEASLRADPRCPASSIVGRAVASTPLLSNKLRGPIYFAKNVRVNKAGREVRTLPTLVIPLRGQLPINLRATTSVRSGKYLVTTFRPPDAAISRVDLLLEGGGKGILVSNTSVCRASRQFDFEVDGQNGAQADSSPTVAASACSRKVRR